MCPSLIVIVMQRRLLRMRADKMKTRIARTPDSTVPGPIAASIAALLANLGDHLMDAVNGTARQRALAREAVTSAWKHTGHERDLSRYRGK